MPRRITMSTSLIHISSIKPTYEERDAFKAFHYHLLEKEAIWHPTVVNYIFRWMHRYNLYNCCVKNCGFLLKLVEAFILRTMLPTTEEVKEIVAAKCTFLIQVSASKWTNEGLLLQHGQYLRKCKTLKDAWTAQKDSLAKAETSMLDELCIEGQAHNTNYSPIVAQQQHEGEAHSDTTLCASKVPRISTSLREKYNGVPMGQAVNSTIIIDGEAPPQITPSQQLGLIGKLIVPDHNQRGSWFIFHIDILMGQTAKMFYDWFSQLLEIEGGVHELTFELIDIFSTRLSGQSSKPPGWSIIRDNDTIFEALKKLVFSSFSAAIKENPSLTAFRIIATSSSFLNPYELARTGKDEFGRAKTSAILLPLEASSSQVVSNTAQSYGKEVSGPFILPYNSNTSISYGPQTPKRVGSSRIPQHPFPLVIIRIQVSACGSMSNPYRLAILGPEVKNVEFFAWFARQTGYGGPNGPAELTFRFRDALPLPKNNVIPRGNEEYFEYMKRDIKPMCGRAAVCMPGLAEFMILVTVPGWVRKV